VLGFLVTAMAFSGMSLDLYAGDQWHDRRQH